MLPCKRLILSAALLLLAGFSGRAQVVTGPARDLTPDLVSTEGWCRLGANATKIAYTNNAGVSNGTGTYQDVYICDLDGTHRQRIAPHLKATEEAGVVSPDGTKVLLHSFANDGNGSGQTDIWVYDIPTGVYTKMTTNTAYDAYPAWSPDGKHIAFLSQRSHDNDSQGYQAWMINSDKPENDTDNVPVQLTNFTGYNDATPPAKVTTGQVSRLWFMDDTHLMFQAMQASVKYTVGTTTTYPYEIYVLETKDSDGDKFGDNLVRLTDTFSMKTWNGNPSTISDPTYTMGRVFFWCNLSPDAQWHEYSLDPTGINKDVWQVTAANYSETYSVAQGDKLVTAINNNDTGSKGIGVTNMDVGLYDLVPDDGAKDSTITAHCLLQGWNGGAGLMVTLYNGGTVIAQKLTDENGDVTFTGLRPGGYFLRFTNDASNTTQVPYSTVTRGVIVAPHGTTAVSAFTAPSAAPRPGGAMATIDNGKVVVQWQPPAESTNATTGFTYQGFNVYRSDNEDAGYTKVNTDLIPKSTNGVYRWVDTSPADLTKSFYKVTAVTTSIATAPNGAQTLESTPSEFAQAANNLVFNPSYEATDANGPLGWTKVLGTTGADNTAGVDTSDFITGGQSQYIGAGATKSGGVWMHSHTPNGSWVVQRTVPTDPAVAYVSGAYIRFTGVTAPSTSTNNYYGWTTQAYAVTEPNGGIPFWYDNGVSPSGGAYRSSQVNGPTTGTAAKPGSTPWTWSSLTATAKAYEYATYTRFSTFANFDTTTSVGTTARALFDDTHYQVKRVGPTGIVWGHIVDSTGAGVSGVLVSDGTVTTYSDPYGIFTLRGVPTGNATVTFTYPNVQPITKTVSNIGGYTFQEDIAFASAVSNIVGGKVTFADGTPAAGAHVRMIFGTSTSGPEPTFESDTDASGNFTLDLTPNATGSPDVTKKVWVVATKGGYQSAYLSNKSVAAAGRTLFNLTLGPAVPVIQVARTTTAIDPMKPFNPAQWANAMPIPLSYKVSTGTPEVGATGYALWDDNNLYVAMVANEPNPAGIVAAISGQDTGVLGGTPTPPTIFGEDNFQFFFDPTVSAAIGTSREVWQVAANLNTSSTGIGISDGTLRTGPASMALGGTSGGWIDNLIPLDGTSGFPMATASVDTANNKWSVVTALPFAGMGGLTISGFTAPTVGTEWRGLFGRYRVQTKEYSASAPVTTGAYASAELWNTLRFVTSVTLPKKGDLNGDGTVDARDVAEALKIAAGITPLGTRLSVGDVTNDSKVDAQDALRISRTVAGLDPAL